MKLTTKREKLLWPSGAKSFHYVTCLDGHHIAEGNTKEAAEKNAQELTAQKQAKARRTLLLAELAKAQRIRREREQGITCTRTCGIEARL